MAFSFNPSQQQPSGGQGISPAGIAPPGGADGQVAPENLPPEGDSPILFIRLRGREMTIAAYLQMLLIVVNVLVVATAIIFFAYSQYLTASISDKKKQVEALDGNFKSVSFDDITRLSLRFSEFGKLLKGYMSISSPLNFLEDVVEKQVYFDEFSVSRTKGTVNYVMNFSVVTTDYKFLIQQLESLNLAKYSKVAPKTTKGQLVDGGQEIKIKIMAPINAQGLLADDVVFVSDRSQSASSSKQSP